MKKLALAALVALASTSAHAAVVISFSGIDTYNGANAPVTGTITVDTTKLPANSGVADRAYYYGFDFASVVINGRTVPVAGGFNENTISAEMPFSDFASTISIVSEADSGLPSQQTAGFGLSTFSLVPTTTDFGGVVLPDFRQANGLTFSIESYGADNSDYSFLTGAVDSISYSETVDAVPEPASWAMMVAGFGLVGGALRRRRVTFAIA